MSGINDPPQPPPTGEDGREEITPGEILDGTAAEADVPGEGGGEAYAAIADDVSEEQLLSGDIGADEIRKADVAVSLRQPVWQRPTVRAGIYAWAILGLLIMAVLFAVVLSAVSTVVIPVVLALFPAAVLSPVSDRLKTLGAPPALAATLVTFGAIGLVTLVVTYIAPQFTAQADVLGAAIGDGYAQLDAFLASGPFGLQPIRLDDLVEGLQQQFREGGGGEVASSALGFALAVFETAAATLLMFVVLFFYLKDGSKIAQWVRSVFPEALHEDVTIIGRMGWHTIGGYIQGQLLVALVDAVFIGLGLWVLGVDLALPLAVIVFIGGLFPIIGATISGILAALVALATDGAGTALLVVALVIVVQQVEGNILQPVIQARLLSLHPLAIILALTVGGFTLGILGAFLAVPVAAATAQTVGYLRRRIPG
ncbi:AI-2E family transporter [soil metagenome]